MRKIYGIVLLCLLIYTAQSQNTGYAGKRFLAKATILSGVQNPFTQIELEGIVSRKFTVSLGFRMNTTTVKQWYYEGEYTTYYNSFDSPFNTKDGYPEISERATIATKMFGAEFRYYLKSYSLPAPRGFYGYLNVYYGTAYISNGVYYQSLYQDLTNPYYYMGGPYYFPDQKYKYTANIKTVTCDFGCGYQEMVTSRISVEVKGGVSYGSLISPDNQTKKAVSGVVKNYGNNLFALRSKTLQELGGTIAPATGTLGLSVFATVGFLLF